MIKYGMVHSRIYGERAWKLIPGKPRSRLGNRATMWQSPVQDGHVQYVTRVLDAIQYSVLCVWNEFLGNVVE